MAEITQKIQEIRDYPKLGDTHKVFREKANIAWRDLATAVPQINVWTTQVNDLRDELNNNYFNFINNINTVAGNKANIDTVSSNINNVNTVATNITDVNTIAPNMSNINITASKITDVETFTKVYQGAFDTAPTTRNDGSDLLDGDLYFDITNKSMKVYSSIDGWKNAGSSVNGIIKRQTFTGDGSTKSFKITGGYDGGYAQIFVNGVLMKNEDDVDVSNGSTIDFTNAPSDGDIVEFIGFGSFQLADHYTKTETDNNFAKVDFSNVDGAVKLDDNDVIKDLNGNSVNVDNALKLEGRSLGDITDFAAIEGPESYNDVGKANWGGDSINTNSNMFEIKKTGILVKQDGYYYCEVVQRAKGTDNQYVILTLDGDRGALENNDKGIWGHDHADNSSNWARSFYLGWLDANSLISGGWVEDGDSAYWGKEGYTGILQVRRIR